MEAKSGNMDGERGNNEPGMVVRGGFRDAFSWGAGKDGLRNSGWKGRGLGVSPRYGGPDSPDSFGVREALGPSERRGRSFVVVLLPRSSFLGRLLPFRCGRLAWAISLTRRDSFLARLGSRGEPEGPGSDDCCEMRVNLPC